MPADFRKGVISLIGSPRFARGAGVIRSEVGHRLVNAAMRYLLVGVVLASLAGLHVLHELESGEAPGAAVCMAPEAQRGALRDTLLQHLRSH